MAKLAALAFLLMAATALVSSASAYSMQGSCAMEMQRPMRNCMNYLQSKMGISYNSGYGEDYLRGCCNELTQLSSECLCDVVQGMTRLMPKMGQMEQMERMACQLPRLCGMMDCGCSSYY